MKTKVTVSKCNATENGNYALTLKSEETRSVVSALGTVNQTVKATYYLFTDKENPVGTEAELDLSLFDIAIRERVLINNTWSVVPDNYNEDDHGTIYKLKTLYPKRAS